MLCKSIAALLCAALVVPPAFAEPAFDRIALPVVKLGVSFGGPRTLATPFDLALQIQHRGMWAQPIASADEVPDTALVPLAFDLVRLQGSGSILRSARLFGRDVLGPEDSENEDGNSDGPGWVWWTVGGIAAAIGLVALASGGGGREDEGDKRSSDGEACNIVGGNNVAGGEAYVFQNCEEYGLPDVP